MSKEQKKISTTALAKKYNIAAKEMFAQLLHRGFIEKKGDLWSLTDNGVKVGGKFVTNQQYGKYITWPEDLQLNDVGNENLITATVIGKHFNLSANKINYIFSEIGWVHKAIKGWRITLQGEKQGGLQDEDKKSGIPFIRWPESIVNSKILISSVQDIQGTKDNEPAKEEVQENSKEEEDFRNKFVAKYRATDGHFVRSKAEMIIDNWLYMAEIVHAYERKLPIEENVYSDFYIPTGKVYIEFWGYENNEKYLARKKTKQELYNKYAFNLIELEDKDVLNLDDILPRLLLKYGVQAY
ncbi:MAG: glycerol kinase [Leadbetterella sp.]|nr:glycerol kinase [Leadbetterella sp.]